jgi:vacuolar-type H+-ATPase subunit C/Vma6
VAGLIGTPGLPTRAIEELARMGSPNEVVALLRAWSHPDADALAEEARREHPDLFRLELAMAVAHASRARAAARRGGHALRDFVSLTVDVDNCWSALLSPRSASPDATPFIDGGRRLDRAQHARALAEAEERAAAAQLAPVFGATPLGDALALRGTAGPSLDEAALDTHIAMQRARARREPMGGATVILFVLRLRQELDRLRRIIWATALEAPPDVRAPHGSMA